MDIELKNARFVQPFVDVVTKTVKINTIGVTRGAFIQEEEYLEPVGEITLTQRPVHKDWVEVYVDGFRIVNASFDFGASHETFEIQGNRIVFHEPQVGVIRVVVDLRPLGIEMSENTIDVNNNQGAKTKGTKPGDLFVAYFCKPIILTEPENGFTKLTDDGLSLVYVPKPNYEGFDAFSYTVINERGQIAQPKCVNVKVGNPTARN